MLSTETHAPFDGHFEAAIWPESQDLERLVHKAEQLLINGEGSARGRDWDLNLKPFAKHEECFVVASRPTIEYGLHFLPASKTSAAWHRVWTAVGDETEQHFFPLKQGPGHTAPKNLPVKFTQTTPNAPVELPPRKLFANPIIATALCIIEWTARRRKCRGRADDWLFADPVEGHPQREDQALDTIVSTSWYWLQLICSTFPSAFRSMSRPPHLGPRPLTISAESYNHLARRFHTSPVLVEQTTTTAEKSSSSDDAKETNMLLRWRDILKDARVAGPQIIDLELFLASRESVDGFQLSLNREIILGLPLVSMARTSSISRSLYTTRNPSQVLFSR